jgi:hypothetical protein
MNSHHPSPRLTCTFLTTLTNSHSTSHQLSPLPPLYRAGVRESNERTEET